MSKTIQLAEWMYRFLWHVYLLKSCRFIPLLKQRHLKLTNWELSHNRDPPHTHNIFQYNNVQYVLYCIYNIMCVITTSITLFFVHCIYHHSRGSLLVAFRVCRFQVASRSPLMSITEEPSRLHKTPSIVSFRSFYFLLPLVLSPSTVPTKTVLNRPFLGLGCVQPSFLFLIRWRILLSLILLNTSLLCVF